MQDDMDESRLRISEELKAGCLLAKKVRQEKGVEIDFAQVLICTVTSMCHCKAHQILSPTLHFQRNAPKGKESIHFQRVQEWGKMGKW